MNGEKEKRISRLFQSGQGKKSGNPQTRRTSGRAQEKQGFTVNPVVLRVFIVIALALITVFLAFPMPDSLLMYEIADRDIKADRDFMVKDLVATKKKQEAARRKSPAVFDLDDLAAQEVREQVHRLFDRGRLILSSPVINTPIFDSAAKEAGPDLEKLAELKKTFNATFNLPPEDKSFDVVAQAGFPFEYERAILRLVHDLLEQGVVENITNLLQYQQNGIVIRKLYSKQEEFVPYIAGFAGLDEARRRVRERALLFTSHFEPAQAQAVVTISQSLIRPNLVMNKKLTNERREEAAGQVSAVYFQVKRGEMIVREGERVDEITRQKINAQASYADNRDWYPRAFGYLILTILFLFVTYRAGFRMSRRRRLTDRDLIFVATLIVINIVIAYAAEQVGDAMAKGFPGVTKTTFYYVTPAAAGAMMAAVILGPLPAVYYAVIASALTGLVFDRSLTFFFYAFLGSIAGLAGLTRVRERGAVSRAGIWVGLVNVGVVVALGFMERIPLNSEAVGYLAAALVSGLLSGIMVSGLIPLFEMSFKYTTNIKLLELANLDQPVLRELMVQAPGTYHHSVIVGAMVEAAAEAIGANPLLCKVSAYYHDLGKMKKPLYFVENQIGENKHEKLAPSMSSLILISHVKDGVELARRHHLSKDIIDIIQQHHGTSLISYFYHKAKDQRTEDSPEINMEDYRYPGPRPQTREAGLVMLADAVEAATRSIPDPNPGRIQGMVQKIINNIFSDGQLDECELTLKDLHLIAKSFNKILTGIFHRRITYPDQNGKDSGTKAKTNGSSAGKPPKETDKDRRDRGERKEDLKRLGIS